MVMTIIQTAFPKYFTLEEAEQLLPKVARLVRQLRQLQESISLLESIEVDINFDEDNFDEDNFDEEMDEEINAEASEQMTEGYVMEPSMVAMNKQFHKLWYQFYEKAEQLENLGCILKDVDLGLVDFPHQFQGREVFLCWRLGEKQIRSWHGLGSGFDSRKPIIR